MNCIGILQARTRSSRLPRKVLAEIGGSSLLALVLERLGAGAPRTPVSEWWVATGDTPEDDALAHEAKRCGVRVYRGDPDDVMERFVSIVAMRRPRWFLRATADNPFVDAALAEALLHAAAGGGDAVDVWTQPADALPLGYGLQLARSDAFLASDRSLADTERYHRVHVLSWLSTKGVVRAFPRPPHWPERPAWRWTVDTPADLAAARAAFGCFARRDLDYPTMVRCLDTRPDIPAINARVRQKRPEEG